MRVRVGGEERWIAADDAGLYRDALGAVPPGGLPEAFLDDVPDALQRLAAPLRAHARPVHDRRAARPLRRRPGAGARGARARRRARARRAAARRAREREWCDPEVLRRLRRASLAVLRKEIEPADQRALARFLPPGRASTAMPPPGAGVDRLREVLVPLQGLALPAEVWERDVLPRRARRLLADVAGPALRRAARSCGSAPGRSARSSGRVALYFRDDAPLLGPPPAPGEPPGGRAHDALRERLAARRLLLHRPARRARRRRRRGAPGGALGPRLGRRGDQRRVRAAARAAPDARPRPRRRSAAPAVRPLPPRRSGGAPQVQGRWSLDGAALRAAPDDLDARRRARAELLLERYGIVTREQVLAEGIPGGFSALYGALGARDARRRPPRLLRRGPRRRAVRAARARSSGCARSAEAAGAGARARRHRPGAALRRGAALAEARRAARRPAAPGAYVVLVGAARCSTSSAAARACACSAPAAADVRAGPRGARRRVRAGRSARLASSASTASRSSLPARRAPRRARLPPRPARLRARPAPAMPEGDTIHYAAHRIRAVLAGRVPDEIATPHPRFARDRWPERLAGRAVEAVDAHGKHLFLRFEGDLVIHSHLRMTGSWGVYGAASAGGARRAAPGSCCAPRRARGRPVRRPGARADDRVAHALRPAPRRAGPRHPRGRASTSALPAPPARGRPDARDRRRPARPAHVAGIGNLWKSEGCLLAGVDPWRPAADGHRRGGARRGPRRPAAHAAVRAPRPPDARPRRSTTGRAGRARAAARRYPRARPGRRQPHDVLVPRMPALTATARAAGWGRPAGARGLSRSA